MKFVTNFILFFLLTFEVNAETVIRFQPHVFIHARQVGDILVIAPDTKNWSKITLDSQPKNGELISKEQIILWLQNKIGIFSYQWKGKKTVIAQQLTQSKAQDLLNKARTELENLLKKQAYSTIKLSSKTQVKDSEVALTDFKIQIPQKYPVAKRVCVRLIHKNHSIPIWFAVRAEKRILIMQHKMKSHTLIQANDVVLKERNIAGLNNKPLSELPPNIWLNKSINKNQILTDEFVVKKPQVIHGEKVKITVHQAGISIITEAIAQSDGYTNQTISMKNSQTNKYFFAVITGENQAEIRA